MKVTLDLTRLLEEGKIDQAEFDKLGALSAQDAGSLAFNILIGFGVAAVSVGTVALVPEPLTAAIVGAAVCASGLIPCWRGPSTGACWRRFASAWAR